MENLENLRKKVFKTLVERSGANKKYKPFTCGQYLALKINLRGYYINVTEVFKDKVYFMSTFSDGYHIIATEKDLTEEECNIVLNAINV